MNNNKDIASLHSLFDELINREEYIKKRIEPTKLVTLFGPCDLKKESLMEDSIWLYKEKINLIYVYNQNMTLHEYVNEARSKAPAVIYISNPNFFRTFNSQYMYNEYDELFDEVSKLKNEEKILFAINISSSITGSKLEKLKPKVISLGLPDYKERCGLLKELSRDKIITHIVDEEFIAYLSEGKTLYQVLDDARSISDMLSLSTEGMDCMDAIVLYYMNEKKLTLDDLTINAIRLAGNITIALYINSTLLEKPEFFSSLEGSNGEKILDYVISGKSDMKASQIMEVIKMYLGEYYAEEIVLNDHYIKNCVNMDKIKKVGDILISNSLIDNYSDTNIWFEDIKNEVKGILYSYEDLFLRIKKFIQDNIIIWLTDLQQIVDDYMSKPKVMM